MLCNICGEDKRCYVLMEEDLTRPPMARANGMVFAICTEDLIRLFNIIRTNNTFFDDPTVVQQAISMHDQRDRLIERATRTKEPKKP